MSLELTKQGRHHGELYAMHSKFAASTVSAHLPPSDRSPETVRHAPSSKLSEFSTAYVGLCFGARKIVAALSDARGNIRAFNTTDALVSEPRRSMRIATELTKIMLEDANVSLDRIRAVGAAVAGIVDHKHGHCVLSRHLNWEKFPVRNELEAMLDRPVAVTTNTEAGALAEGRFGAAKGHSSYVWIYVGTGIAAGVVSDGTIFRGWRGFSGEFGHCKAGLDGPLLEELASEGSIERIAREAAAAHPGSALAQLSSELTFSEVLALARGEDPICVEIVQKATRYLGLGVSYLLNILNPELVVVSGKLFDVGELVMDPLLKSVARHCLQPEQTLVVRSMLGNRAGVLGAVLAAVERAEAERLRATR